MRSSTYIKLVGLFSLLLIAVAGYSANKIPKLITDNLVITDQSANTAAVFDASKNVISSAVSTTTLGLLNTATNANTASTLVERDGSGNFSAGTISANLIGNASTVTTNANLTGDVTSVGNATTIGAGKVSNSMLAGSIAASKLVGSDIATVGTITAGVWTGTAIAIANGGSGQTSANAALNAFLPTQTSNSGKVLTTDGSNTSWGTVLTNPMTTGGDVIYGGSAGAPTRLANGSLNQVLTSSGGNTAPTWTTPATNELVVYRTNTGTVSATTNAIVNYGTVTLDTNSRVATGASWAYTAPATANYLVCAHLTWASQAWSASKEYDLYVYVNGSKYASIGMGWTWNSTTSLVPAMGGCTVAAVTSGQSINIHVFNGDSGSKTIEADSNDNWVAITRLP